MWDREHIAWLNDGPRHNWPPRHFHPTASPRPLITPPTLAWIPAGTGPPPTTLRKVSNPR